MKRSLLIKKIIRYVFLLIGICLLGSTTANAELTIGDEKKLGQQFYDRMLNNGFLIQEKRMSDYITKVGMTVLRSVKNPLFEYRFSIVKDSSVNAFATPGGYVYVNRGLIALVASEAELAAVLAHEIAHVNARHIADMVNKASKVNIATLLGVIAGAFMGGGDLSAAVMGFSLATAQTMTLKYSRDNEEEADRYGMLYLVRAGYKAEASLNVLKMMRRYEFYSSSVPSYFMTHPGTDDRLRYIDGLLQTTYAEAKGKDEIVGPFGRIRTVLMTGGADVEAKIRYFEGEVKKDTKNVDSLYGLGVVQARKGLYGESLATLQQALLLAPLDKEVLRDIGVNYFKLGQYPQSIDYLLRAYKIDRHDWKTLAYLGNSHEAMGLYAQALGYFRALEKTDLDDAEIYYSIAMAYGKLKEMGDSHYYFGIYFKKQKKTESALFHFKEALKYFVINTPKYQDIEKEIRLLSMETDAKKRPEGKRRN
ncbi:MAG: M48 family metalloprotease [Syntrophales bacterium]|nr:M48 family metalloprotease [Syntrophales bacterium]